MAKFKQRTFDPERLMAFFLFLGDKKRAFSEVIEQQGLTGSSVQRFLNALEKEGLVKLYHLRSEEVNEWVRITDLGRQRLKYLIQATSSGEQVLK